LPQCCSSPFLFSRSKQTHAVAAEVVGGAGAVTPQESADTAADLADTAALLPAAEVLTPSTARISVGRVVSVGHEPVAPGWQLVRLAAAVSSDVP